MFEFGDDKTMENTIFEFELGTKVKDKLTGFRGYITGRAQYLTGCVQYSVIPKVDKKKTGTYPDGIWLDEDRLAKDGAKFKINVKISGGPQQHPNKN